MQEILLETLIFFKRFVQPLLGFLGFDYTLAYDRRRGFLVTVWFEGLNGFTQRAQTGNTLHEDMTLLFFFNPFGP